IDGDLGPIQLTTEGKMALSGLLLAAVALMFSSAFGLPLGAPTCGAAIMALFVVASRNGKIVGSVARGVTWSVLPLVAGLFVIVQALQNAGMLRTGLAGMQAIATLPSWIAKCGSAFAVALASNGMNNLPVGLISRAAISQGHQSGIIA